MPTRLTLDAVEDLARRILVASGASALQAGATARSIRDAEADGIRNVGLGYLPIYANHLACGKVTGDAVPAVTRPLPGIVAVDAQHGFAHPAFEAGAPDLLAATRRNGVAVMAVGRSYSSGVVGWFVERLADDGLVAMMFSNSSSTMAPWGGKVPFFGTNPIAWACPRAAGPPVVADMSAAAVAWVTLKDHADAGLPIPPTWALDADGSPTTDARVGLAGSIAPSGGHKGSALALLVDLLSGAATGSSFSFEASSFGDDTGGPPNVGQLIIAIDGAACGGPGFLERVEADLVAMTAQPGVRLPGARRLAHRATAAATGVEVPDALMALLDDYAAHGSPSRRS